MNDTEKANDNRLWYVVHTYSGYENKVKANLEKRVESMGMEEEIFQVIVPVEDVVEYKDGKKKITPRKVFPGYVMVEMIVTDDSWYVSPQYARCYRFCGQRCQANPLGGTRG